MQLSLDQIIPNLYLTGVDRAKTCYSKFDLVINIAYPDNGASKGGAIGEYVNGNTKILSIGEDDTPVTDLYSYFPKLMVEINKYLGNGKKVLIHCHQGISRSVTIVIAYLLYKKKCPDVQSCLEFVRSKRGIVQPNIGFMRQLEDWHKVCNKVN